MDTNKKTGAAECGDCNTCGKCDEQQVTENFDAAVRAAAAIDRDSYEKNLARQRKATLANDTRQDGQHETFTRNAVARRSSAAQEGSLLNHEGLPLFTLIIYSENYAGVLNQNYWQYSHVAR